MSYFKSGSWNVICELCGRQFKSDEVRKRWDGLWVCQNDYEARHVLDFIRTPAETGTVPYVSPEPAPTYIYICYVEHSQGIADLGEADCARADVQLNIQT